MKIFLLLFLLCTALAGRSQSVKQAQTVNKVKMENPPGLPKPNGYSHAAVIDLGNQVMIIMSGQVALDSTGKTSGAEIMAQTTQVFNNIKTIVEHYGGGMGNIVKLGYFVIAAGDVPAIRIVRDKFINTVSPPASTLVVVKQLFRPDLLVEIEATAIVPKKNN